MLQVLAREKERSVEQFLLQDQKLLEYLSTHSIKLKFVVWVHILRRLQKMNDEGLVDVEPSLKHQELSVFFTANINWAVLFCITNS